MPILGLFTCSSISNDRCVHFRTIKRIVENADDPKLVHNVSLAFLLLGALTAAIIIADEYRHSQHMWIMNVVWPVTALFGTAWIACQYFSYGRLATRAEMHAATEEEQQPPNKRGTPFPIMVANGTLHCGSGCTLGDIMAEWLVFAVRTVAVAFGWRSLFSEKIDPSAIQHHANPGAGA